MATSPKQDKISALPLQLLDEEVTLLLEKGHAILKTFPSLSEPPNEKLNEKSKAHRERFLQDQVENHLKNKPISTLHVYVAHILKFYFD